MSWWTVRSHMYKHLLIIIVSVWQKICRMSLSRERQPRALYYRDEALPPAPFVARLFRRRSAGTEMAAARMAMPTMAPVERSSWLLPEHPSGKQGSSGLRHWRVRGMVSGPALVLHLPSLCYIWGWVNSGKICLNCAALSSPSCAQWETSKQIRCTQNKTKYCHSLVYLSLSTYSSSLVIKQDGQYAI